MPREFNLQVCRISGDNFNLALPWRPWLNLTVVIQSG